MEDVNDHAPQFVNAPYHVTVDELTPTGKHMIIIIIYIYLIILFMEHQS